MTFYKGFTPERANSVDKIWNLYQKGKITLKETRIESGWGIYTVINFEMKNGRPVKVVVLDVNGETVKANDSFLNTRNFRTAPPA